MGNWQLETGQGVSRRRCRLRVPAACDGRTQQSPSTVLSDADRWARCAAGRALVLGHVVRVLESAGASARFSPPFSASCGRRVEKSVAAAVRLVCTGPKPCLKVVEVPMRPALLLGLFVFLPCQPVLLDASRPIIPPLARCRCQLIWPRLHTIALPVPACGSVGLAHRTAAIASRLVPASDESGSYRCWGRLV